MGKLDGKIAVITGGSEGIGLATAQCFLEEGTEHVFITGRRQEALDQAIQNIGKTNITTVQADSGNLNDLDKPYDLIKRTKGRLDIVFANAGIGPLAPEGSISEKDFDALINVNVKGVLFTAQKALPLLTDGGSIILNGSVASVKGVPGTSVYSATKAAVRSFARCWTVDLKERNIRVNTISPGPIQTSILNNFGTNEQENRKILDQLKASTAMNRIDEPNEIAKDVLFLAANDSTFIIGIELFVDGGHAQIINTKFVFFLKVQFHSINSFLPFSFNRSLMYL